MRYAGPWKQRAYDSYSIEDTNGRIIIDEFHVSIFDEATDATGETQEIERLVLAAPELLESLEYVLNRAPIAPSRIEEFECDPRVKAARMLIDRIRKGPNG